MLDKIYLFLLIRYKVSPVFESALVDLDESRNHV